MKTVLTFISLLTICSGCAHTVTLLTSPANPSAKGTLEISKDDNENTIVKLKVEHLAKPKMLSPPRSIYIVWVETPVGMPQKLGQLVVDDNLSGYFEGSFFGKKFRLLVSAEDSADSFGAGPQVVLSSEEIVAK